MLVWFRVLYALCTIIVSQELTVEDFAFPSKKRRTRRFDTDDVYQRLLSSWARSFRNIAERG